MCIIYIIVRGGKRMKDYFVLNNGVKIPSIALGTFKVEDGNEVINAVKWAIETGYRHIDTAAIYKNEVGVGKGIKESGIDRKKIFVTTKVWNDNQGYKSTLKAFEDSLERLGLDYIDLYLIHWPKKLNLETWRALEKLYKDGRIRAIGVSNFKIHHLKEIMENFDIIPAINQVELHPQYPQDELRKFCNKHGIVVEAWAPLMQGRIFEIELFGQLAEKYNKSISQIALRWQLQMGVLPLPKSTKKDRIINNFNIFDFEISKEDMKKIEKLKGDRIGPDPDFITF